MRAIVRDYQSRPVLTSRAVAAMAEVLRRRIDVAAGILGVAFVDDDLMSAHHSRFMGCDTTTDVLSFPDDPEVDRPVPRGCDRADPDASSYWGDIIVCTDQAARQARELGHPYGYELTVLVVHGVLHLLGYDHTRDDGRMRRLERRLRPLCRAAGLSA